MNILLLKVLARIECTRQQVLKVSKNMYLIK